MSTGAQLIQVLHDVAVSLASATVVTAIVFLRKQDVITCYRALRRKFARNRRRAR